MVRIKSIFIIGWYGTETVGDKAILGGILTNCYHEDRDVKIKIASLYPFVTHRTVDELNVNAEVIPVYSHKFLLGSALSDEVIMGGGPLMGMQALLIPLWAFLIAKLFGKKRIVWGCGLGPLREEHHIRAVKQILLLSNVVKLRDAESAKWAYRLTARDDIQVIDDPARDYVLSRQSLLVLDSVKKKEISCFLREWPYEYGGEVSDRNEFHRKREKFEKKLAGCLSYLATKYDLRLVFYPMHSFTVGNDDRSFNRKFVSNYLSKVDVEVVYKPASVDNIITAMLSSKLCVCMRFHSVLFAHTLGVDFIAIDYTSGGKIQGFLADKNSLDKCISLADIALGKLDQWDALVHSYFEDIHTNH